MPNLKYNVLVTGCGGDIGQSIAKILNSIKYIHKVIGTDLHEDHAGKFLVDKHLIVPRVDAQNYFATIGEIIRLNKIDIWISASEPEIRYFTDNEKSIKKYKSKLIIASRLSRIVGFDKFKTFEFLKDNNFPFPKTFLLERNSKMALKKSIIKSRNGSGSKDIFICNQESDFNYYKKKYKNFICQEFIESTKEITCCIYKNNSVIKTILIDRKLTSGYTGYGRVVHDKKIESYLNLLAKRIKLKGSINIQLRVDKDGVPVIFEINPRFSSTVLFRHLCGFKDLQWSLEDKVKIKSTSMNKKIPLVSFYKGYSEYVV